jgi:hypothetical protein
MLNELNKPNNDNYVLDHSQHNERPSFSYSPPSARILACNDAVDLDRDMRMSSGPTHSGASNASRTAPSSPPLWNETSLRKSLSCNNCLDLLRNVEDPESILDFFRPKESAVESLEDKLALLKKTFEAKLELRVAELRGLQQFLMIRGAEAEDREQHLNMMRTHLTRLESLLHEVTVLHNSLMEKRIAVQRNSDMKLANYQEGKFRLDLVKRLQRVGSVDRVVPAILRRVQEEELVTKREEWDVSQETVFNLARNFEFSSDSFVRAMHRIKNDYQYDASLCV